jgi:hypothetical protein
MTPEARDIMEEMAERGKVPPKTFVGRGFVVSWCVRYGWLEWERNKPGSMTATALVITPLGRAALQQTPGA